MYSPGSGVPPTSGGGGGTGPTAVRGRTWDAPSPKGMAARVRRAALGRPQAPRAEPARARQAHL